MSETTSRLVRGYFRKAVELVDELTHENERLRQELARAEAQLHERTAPDAEERARRLEAELARAERENREYAGSCVDLQNRLVALSGLHVAAFELHASLELTEVLRALEEIVINLLGSESFTIYLADAAGTSLACARTMDPPPGAPESIAVGQGPLGLAAARLEPWSEGASGSGSGARVVVPLRVRDQLVGLVAVFGFLSHKKTVTDVDRELFQLLASQAGTAIHAAMLFGREARRASTFENLLGLVRESRTSRSE